MSRKKASVKSLLSRAKKVAYQEAKNRVLTDMTEMFLEDEVPFDQRIKDMLAIEELSISHSEELKRIQSDPKRKKK
jgi:hypothetical protein